MSIVVILTLFSQITLLHNNAVNIFNKLIIEPIIYPAIGTWTMADGKTPGYDNVSKNDDWSNTPQFALDSNQNPNIVWMDSPPGSSYFDICFSKWNGATWTKADGITQGYDKISNNGDNGQPQIALDSFQNPNIAWVCCPMGLNSCNIVFSKWNGSAWTGADGKTPGYDYVGQKYGMSYNPKLVLDSAQNLNFERPNIVWQDYGEGHGDIFFSKWNGFAWTKADEVTLGYDNISNNFGESHLPEIVLDSSQRPNIVWFDESEGHSEIFFSKWNGFAWTKADGTTPGYDNVSNTDSYSVNQKIALDSEQNPNIVWMDGSTGNDEILFSKWNGSYWTCADGETLGSDNISNNIGSSAEPQIKLDSSQNPNIVWQDDTTGQYGNLFDIYFSKWNDSNWTGADGRTIGYDNVSKNRFTSEEPQFALDSEQKPNIVWINDETLKSGYFDIYFSKWNGSIWTGADGITLGSDNVSRNSGGSDYPKILLDSAQQPNIVWADDTEGNGDIFFIKFSLF